MFLFTGNNLPLTSNKDATVPRNAEEIQRDNISKQQGVFHIDFDTWEDIIDAYDIKECVIPHRQTEEEANIGASGWYG